MNLESVKVSVEKSSKEVFKFLIDLKNFKNLMPKDIQKFESDGTSLLFSLRGMPEIRLVLKEKIEFSSVILISDNEKIPFTLTVNIREISENKSEVKLLFSGNFNPMMSMMIKKPLSKFIDVLANNLLLNC